nr:adenosylcobinamide-GDP ribazoletransferase [Herbihabitans rhizosphaerae]
MSGLRLALSWLTVLPVRGPSTVDTRTARAAIATAPLVGALLGVIAAGLGQGAHALGTPALLAGFVTVGALALLTRGMHLDGLADTADGLGCYGPPERALAVMRDGGAGPFGVAALVIALGAQAAALGALIAHNRWGAIVLALATSRAAFTWCCRRGVPAARETGLGALVAGTQHPVIPAAWLIILAAIGIVAVPGYPWLGPIAVAAAAAVTAGLSWHTTRRFGGLTGDVLGAAAELATTIVLVVCALS